MYTKPKYQKGIERYVDEQQMSYIDEVAKMLDDNFFIYAAIINDLNEANLDENLLVLIEANKIKPDQEVIEEVIKIIERAQEIIARSIFATVVQYLERFPDSEIDLAQLNFSILTIFNIASPKKKEEFINRLIASIRKLNTKI